MIGWVQDVAIAYVGGIALGTPPGLLAAWATNREQLLTAAILCAMAGVIIRRRILRRAGAPHGNASSAKV